MQSFYTKPPLSELIQAAVTIVDAEGEYVAGDSYDRIAVIDAAISIRIRDLGNDPAIIEIEFEDVVVFRAIAERRDEFEVEIFSFGEWLDDFNSIANTASEETLTALFEKGGE